MDTAAETAKQIKEKKAALKKIKETIEELQAKADALGIEIFTLITGIVPGSEICARNGKRRYKAVRVYYEPGMYRALKVKAQRYLSNGQLSPAEISVYAGDVVLVSEYEKQEAEFKKHAGKVKLI